jgi:Skp family chaperone for outer membrane proteins
MARDWINRHPKLVFLVIGILMMVFTNFGQYALTDKIIEEYQSRIETHEKERIERTAKLKSLTEEVKRLKSRTKTYKIVKPDGTIEERTETELESESSLSQNIQQEYEEKISREIAKIQEELKTKITERKKLNIAVGSTVTGTYWINGAYNVWGPVTLNAGIFPTTQTYLIGIGLDI